jgi:wyosine [tRNA(Phe)-imidazoG37] synthetase (radical SAM superfamily)
MFFYSISRPGKDGSPSSLTQWLKGFEYFRAEDEERNALRTKLIEQAAHDKHLFLNAEKNPHIELKMPEYVVPSVPPVALFSGRMAPLKEERRKTQKGCKKTHMGNMAHQILYLACM